MIVITVIVWKKQFWRIQLYTLISVEVCASLLFLNNNILHTLLSCLHFCYYSTIVTLCGKCRRSWLLMCIKCKLIINNGSLKVSLIIIQCIFQMQTDTILFAALSLICNFNRHLIACSLKSGRNNTQYCKCIKEQSGDL